MLTDSINVHGIQTERIKKLADKIGSADHYRYSDEEDEDNYRSVSEFSLFQAMEEEATPTWFNLCDYVTYYADEIDCDTVGCIAGFCMGLYPPETVDRYAGFVGLVAGTLGIPGTVAYNLCVAPVVKGCFGDPADITPAQAAQAVRNLLEPGVASGEVNPWEFLREQTGRDGKDE